MMSTGVYMIESLAGSFPVSAEQLRTAIYAQFGLPNNFRFEFVFFTGGNEDVFSLTTSHDLDASGRKRFQKYSCSARLTKERRELTAGEFVEIRDAYVKRLCKIFDCHVVDFGIGFPPTGEALATRDDVEHALEHREALAADGTAVALYNFARLTTYDRLRHWKQKEGKFWPKEKTVAPFGWPFHEVTNQWAPDERHYTRQVLHIGNAVTWVFSTYYVAEGKFPAAQLLPIFLCSGTPK
jgi:hypothetical protein